MNITIRYEKPEDYRAVEELTRDAFWGVLGQSTCSGEPLLVHRMRKLPSYIPELDFVAEADGRLAGHIISIKSKVVHPDGGETEVLTLGPLSVRPEYKGRGVGGALMRHTLTEAAGLGCGAIVIYGHPDYYPRFGFKRAKAFGITAPGGKSFDALMAMELRRGALDGVTGEFFEDEVFNIDPSDEAEFERTMSPKAPAELVTVRTMCERLGENAARALTELGVTYVSGLQGVSGAEIAAHGVSAEELEEINEVLKAYGEPRKLRADK